MAKILLSIILFLPCFLRGQVVKVETPLLKGELKDDRTIGVWEFYDSPGILSLKIDYDNNKLLYFAPDTSIFYVANGDTWVKSRLTRPTRFHGSYPIFKRHFIDRQLFRPYEKLPVTIWLTFVVGEDGTAASPEVSGAPDEATKTKILELFQSAPNTWIPGIRGGVPVKTKMAIGYHITNDFKNPPTTDATVIDVNLILFQTKNELPRTHNDFIVQGLQWSPDDKHILFSSTDIAGPKVPYPSAAHRQFGFINRDTKRVTIIPYPDVIRYYWLNVNTVFFKYNGNPYLNKRVALFDLTQSKVIDIPDSISYYNIASFRQNRVAFITHDKESTFLWEKNMANGQLIKIESSKIRKTIFQPQSWSPDGSLLLSQEFNEDTDNSLLFTYDHGTQIRTNILLKNCAFIGWSNDGNSLFLAEIKRGDFRSILTPYVYDLKNKTAVKILDRSKSISEMKYNSAANKLLIVDKDDLYEMGTQPGDEPQLILKDIRKAAWSNDGNQIAYVSESDLEIYVMDAKSRKTEKLTDFKQK